MGGGGGEFHVGIIREVMRFLHSCHVVSKVIACLNMKSKTFLGMGVGGGGVEIGGRGSVPRRVSYVESMNP